MKDILAKLAAIDAAESNKVSAQTDSKKKLTESFDAHHPDELPYDEDEMDSADARHPDELPYDDLDEAKPAAEPAQYPDTKEGAIACLTNEAQKSWVKSLDLATCQVQADPSVEGVWAIDSLATGTRVIVYLGGFRDPWGQVREYSDFEEGSMPMSKMRRLMNLEGVSAKQLKNWLKRGTIDDAQYSELMEYLGEGLGEAKADKGYTIVMTRDRDGREMKSSGTLAELIEYYRYTLETGQSYQREKGNAKINCNPTNIGALVKNLNNAVNNAAANGYAGKTYRVEDAVVTETSEDEWDEDPYDPEDPAPMVTDEAVNHMGDREYQSWHGWKAACRKVYPGCTFYGDRDIGGANLNGKDVGEWDGSVGCVYNDSMSGIPMGEATEVNEDEQIDEISGATLGSYVQKARQDARARSDHGKELDADPKVAADKEKISGWYNDRKYTKDGRSVHRNKIDKARERIEARKQKIDPDYPASANPNKRLRGVEKAIKKMQYGNLTDSVNNVSEAKAPTLASRIKNAVYADQISKDKNGNYIFRRGYFYRNGMDSDKWAQRVADDLAKAGIEATLVDSYDHWAAFKGGASVKAGSHFAAIFNIPEQAAAPVAEDRDEEPRLAFGKRDWEMDSEMNPHDPYLEYRAKGGNLSRRDWEFDRSQRNPWDSDELDESAVNEVSQDTLKSYKQKATWATNSAALKGDRATAVKRNKGLTNAAKRLPKEEPKTYGGDSIQRDYYSDKPGQRYVGDSVNRSGKPVSEAKKPKDLDAAIRKYGHEHPKTIKAAEREEKKVAKQGKKVAESKEATVILEGVKFRVSDPKLAKVLRRFPHEAMKLDAGGELDDRLYDALYDHYLNNGEMPYGVAKARDGDPYEWVTDKIATDLSSRNNVFAESDNKVNPEIEEIFDKYPHEAKLFRETGELDDGPLYEELFDHYCNNGEMPYGVAKARDGDPLQWVADQLERDLGQGLQESNDELFVEEEIDLDEALTPAQQERMERMRAQDAEWAKVKSSVEAGQRGYRNPFASETPAKRDDELAWRSQQLAKNGKASSGLAVEDSVDPTPTDADDEVLVEQTHDEIVDTLSSLGFDEGLDFFFDGEDLVVIGRSTARAVINAVGGHIISIDGEEVRISNKPKAKVVPSKAEVADLAAEPEMFESKKANSNTLSENMTVSIQADGEEDVLSVIRKLSGVDNVVVTPAPVGIPSALAVIDSIQADDIPPADETNFDEFQDEVATEFTTDEEVEECYANTPEPEEQIGLSTTISNAGNEPGRRAYTAGNAVTESRIVRQYSKGQK